MNIEENKNHLSWTEWYMRGVYWIASKSKDPRTKIGAILVKNNRIISTGYNGFPQSVKEDIKDRWERPLKYLFVSHGERNAIYAAAKHGSPTEGCTIYTNALPCSDCMKAIIQSGITKVVIHKQFEDHCKNVNRPEWEKHAEVSMMMSKESGVDIEIADYFLNIETLFVGKIIKI